MNNVRLQERHSTIEYVEILLLGRIAYLFNLTKWNIQYVGPYNVGVLQVTGAT